MARTGFSAALDTRPHYLSLVWHKIPGEAAWTLVQQGRTLTPDQTADSSEAARIGDKNKVTTYGSIKTEVTLRMYYDHDVQEIAAVLGYRKPGGGWLGTELIQLDPSKVSDFKVENFDGATATANLVSVEYINRFKPGRFNPPLDADEAGGRTVELSGSADGYYIIPVIG